MTNLYPKQSTRENLKKGEIPTRPEDLPVSQQDELEEPSGYIAHDYLADALNVALLLGQPLLLTGEPGTGKTQFAYSAMYWLGFNRLIRFNVKSTTQARDFFYQIDEIRRFRDAQLGGLLRKSPGDDGVDKNGATQANHDQTELLAEAKETEATNQDGMIDPLILKNYTRLGPLGEAILRANSPERYPDLPQPEKHQAIERSIVLIDEIDKAPRDVPNDLLNELENIEFQVPELGLTVQADRGYRPAVIITSNSERNLPDAFMRRCVYYNIPFPGEEPQLEGEAGKRNPSEELNDIVRSRLPKLEPKSVWLEEALELFRQFRQSGRGLQKRPGTGELLNWLQLLYNVEEVMESTSLKRSPVLFHRSLPVLMKNESDARIARQIFDHYCQQR